MRNLNQIKSLKNVKLLNDDQIANIKGGDGEDKPDYQDYINGVGGTPLNGNPFGGGMDDRNP